MSKRRFVLAGPCQYIGKKALKARSAHGPASCGPPSDVVNHVDERDIAVAV